MLFSVRMNRPARIGIADRGHDQVDALRGPQLPVRAAVAQLEDPVGGDAHGGDHVPRSHLQRPPPATSLTVAPVTRPVSSRVSPIDPHAAGDDRRAVGSGRPGA
jgi:hypothetical protein